MGYTQKMRFFDLSVWKTSSSEAFLLPLTECSALGMADITDMTANICDSIYKEASNGKSRQMKLLPICP